MWRTGRTYRIVGWVALATFGLSCSTWKTSQVPPAQAVTEKHPDHVRVQLATGGDLELWGPQILGDSLVGTRKHTEPGDTTGRVAVALADIRQLQVRGTSAGTTVAMVGIGVGALLVIAAIAASGSSTWSCTGGKCQSCPFVYAWNGRDWQLASGTFGGAIMSGLARTAVDNLPAVPPGPTVELRITNELRETDYVDRVAVLAVDHPPGVTIAPDGQGRLHSVGPLAEPLAARDFRGHDALARVRVTDGWAWETAPAGRDSSVDADVRDGLEVTFPRPPGASEGQLVIDAANTAWAEYMMARFVSLHGTGTEAWYDSVAANRALATEIGAMMAREIYLAVYLDVGGRWERRGLVREAGPEVWKRQVVPLDLKGVAGDVIRVRLESAPALWLVDGLAMDYAPSVGLETRELAPARAVDHRGTDVRSRLLDVDGRFYRLDPGDAADLTFAVPPVPPGSVRSYALVTHGWYRIQAPAEGAPQTALLDRALKEPLAASRIVTGDLQAAVAALARR
jgi:hypothetical protein